MRKIQRLQRAFARQRAAFDRAVEDVAAAARALIASLVTTADPRDREVEAARARARSAARFAQEAPGTETGRA